jgi:hypothetical protein
VFPVRYVLNAYSYIICRRQQAAPLVKLSEFVATDPEVWVRIPALPDFLGSGFGRGPLSLVSTIEDLLERKNSGCGLESRGYGRRYSSR